MRAVARALLLLDPVLKALAIALLGFDLEAVVVAPQQAGGGLEAVTWQRSWNTYVQDNIWGSIFVVPVPAWDAVLLRLV